MKLLLFILKKLGFEYHIQISKGNKIYSWSTTTYKIRPSERLIIKTVDKIGI